MFAMSSVMYEKGLWLGCLSYDALTFWQLTNILIRFNTCQCHGSFVQLRYGIIRLFNSPWRVKKENKTKLTGLELLLSKSLLLLSCNPLPGSPFLFSRCCFCCCFYSFRRKQPDVA